MELDVSVVSHPFYKSLFHIFLRWGAWSVLLSNDIFPTPSSVDGPLDAVLCDPEKLHGVDKLKVDQDEK